MNAPLTYIKNACLIFGTLFLLTIPVVWLSLTEVNFHGDLTRIGKLSERDFSWDTQQPQIDEALREITSIKNADVLVIGDSFSASLIWQTKLTGNKIKVATYHWDNVGLICENFANQVAKSGFRGKKIYFEIVELGLEDKLKKSLACINSNNQLTSPITKSSPVDKKPKLTKEINLTGQYIVGVQTLINSFLLNNFSQSWEILNKRSKSAKLAPISNGCAMFSNKLCHLGLFYHQDYNKQILAPELVKSMKILESRLEGYNITWVIVPNKSTVYHRLEGKDFWNYLEYQGMGPDLLKHFLIAKNHIVDFYKPNDTHLSTAGYLHLGQIIQQWKTH